ncbi:MAG: glycosyltransferase [Planctomycetaceae bacterium]|nr:glycosyltransferase [Planctomycetaceae bacterium]
MPPTRIAFGITELDAGGAERILTQLVLGLDHNEWEPQVWSLGPAGPYADVLREGGIPVHCLDAVHTWDAPRILWRLRREWRAFQPVILQTFLFHANILGRLAGRWAGVPHVVSGIRVADRRSRFFSRVDRWTNSLVERNICVSRGVADYCEKECGFDPAKTVIIPNGVDARLFAQADPLNWQQLGLPPDATVLLSIGRLEEQKGIDDLLKAFATIVQQFPTAHLVLVGDGSDRQKLEACSVSLGLVNRVRFLGRRTDVPQLLAGADLFVLASRWEGMPNVILEAMAAGLPVVATRVEGTSELITEGETGWLVPANDSAVLAERLQTVLASPDAKQAVGLAAQHAVKSQFTTEVMVRKYVALYRQMISDAT